MVTDPDNVPVSSLCNSDSRKADAPVTAGGKLPLTETRGGDDPRDWAAVELPAGLLDWDGE